VGISEFRLQISDFGRVIFEADSSLSVRALPVAFRFSSFDF